MANKIKTIRLAPHTDPHSLEGEIYRVEQITDSIEFVPSKYLTKKQVVELCEAKDWKVTVVERK